MLLSCCTNLLCTFFYNIIYNSVLFHWFPIIKQHFSARTWCIFIVLQVQKSQCKRLQSILWVKHPHPAGRSFIYEWFCIAPKHSAVSAGFGLLHENRPLPHPPHRMLFCWFLVAHELFHKRQKICSITGDAHNRKHPLPRVPLWDVQSFNKAEETEKEKNQ